LLPVVLYFWAVGLLPRLLLVFSLGRDYVEFRNTDPETLLLWPFYAMIGLGLNNAVLLIYSFAGFTLILLASRRQNRHDGQRNAVPLYVAVWYLLSFAEAQVTRALFYHYYLLIVPALALLAGWLLAKLAAEIATSVPKHWWLASVALMSLLLPALLISAGQHTHYYSLYIQYKLGRVTFAEFVRDGWPGVGWQMVAVQDLADYIAERTTPDERIYYWSGGVQLYYVANRRSSVDIIWPLYLGATGPHERIFDPKTKYLILGESNNVPRPEWLEPGAAEHFVLETIIHGQEVYRHLDYYKSQ
jgi:hypothetical protein